MWCGQKERIPISPLVSERGNTIMQRGVQSERESKKTMLVGIKNV